MGHLVRMQTLPTFTFPFREIRDKEKKRKLMQLGLFYIYL